MPDDPPVTIATLPVSSSDISASSHLAVHCQHPASPSVVPRGPAHRRDHPSWRHDPRLVAGRRPRPAIVQHLRATSTSTRCSSSEDLDVPASAQQYLCGLLVGSDPPADRGDRRGEHAPLQHPDLQQGRGRQRALRAAPVPRRRHVGESPQELSLYGERVDQPSVPTVFVSAVNAWDRLPDELKCASRRLQRRPCHRRAEAATRRRAARRTTHGRAIRATPIPKIHPRTGRPILYVSQMMTTEIEGLPPDESERLLEELFDVLYEPSAASSTTRWRPRGLGQPRGPARAHGDAARA